MTFKLWKNAPFNLGNELDPVEVQVGDGITRTFTLTKLDASRLGASIVCGSLYFSRFSNPPGFTVDGQEVTLLSAPAEGVNVVFSGVGAAVLAAFDSETAGDDTSANITETTIYAGDSEEIAYWTYGALPGNTGIVISPYDAYAEGGAEADWLQFAPLLADGTIGTYGDPGEEIDLGTLEASDELQDAILSGATSIEVADGSQFTSGRFVSLGYGTAFQESRQITAMVGNVLTISGTDYAHDAGELVFENIIGFAVKLTVPEGITGGTAVNLYDLPLRKQVRWTSRI